MLFSYIVTVHARIALDRSFHRNCRYFTPTFSTLDLGEELNCLAFDGQTILVGGGSGALSVWDILHVRSVGKIQAHKGPITSLWVSEDGQFLATGGDDRRVVVWKSNTLKKT